MIKNELINQLIGKNIYISYLVVSLIRFRGEELN